MESIVLWIVTGIALGPMFIISAVLLTGHGSSLVAGYNTMPSGEQKKWKEKTLCRFVGAMLLVFSLLLAGAILCASLDWMVLFWVFTGLGVLELSVGVIYLNKSRRFKEK